MRIRSPLPPFKPSQEDPMRVRKSIKGTASTTCDMLLDDKTVLQGLPSGSVAMLICQSVAQVPPSLSAQCQVAQSTLPLPHNLL